MPPDPAALQHVTVDQPLFYDSCKAPHIRQHSAITLLLQPRPLQLTPDLWGGYALITK